MVRRFGSDGGLGDSDGGLGDSDGGLGDSDGGLGDSDDCLREVRRFGRRVRRFGRLRRERQPSNYRPNSGRPPYRDCEDNIPGTISEIREETRQQTGILLSVP